MEQYSLIAQLQQRIINNPCDIKAESLLAIAMTCGLTADDFSIAFDSLFLRSYSKDILSSTLKEDAGRRTFLQLLLSRNGIYDQLPEGIFHQPAQPKATISSELDMAADSNAKKQKQREIRRFFMPFENAFFWQRLQLELEEVCLLEGMRSGTVNEYFMDFWGVSTAITPSLATPLLELLPYASKIAGNLAITAQCLEKIVQEKVTVRIVSAPPTQAKSGCTHQLGQQRLGIDMVMGDHFEEDYPLIEFTIGPLQSGRVSDYLEGGDKENFLKIFYSFFVPAEAEVITRIEVGHEKQHMILNTEAELILGYSSILF